MRVRGEIVDRDEIVDIDPQTGQATLIDGRQVASMRLFIGDVLILKELFGEGLDAPEQIG